MAYQELLDGFGQPGWKRDPWEVVSGLTRADEVALADALVADLSPVPATRPGATRTCRKGHIVDATADQCPYCRPPTPLPPIARARSESKLDADLLLFIGPEDWPRVVDAVIDDALVRRGKKAKDVLNRAAAQCPAALHRHLDRLFAAAVEAGDDDVEDWLLLAWRGAPQAKIDFLLSTVEKDPDADRRVHGWRCLLWSGRPEGPALAAEHPEWLADDRVEEKLASLGFARRKDGSLRRLFPERVLHLGFARERPWKPGDRVCLQRPVPPDELVHRFGGTTGTPCARCGAAGHHLITLDPVPEGLGVTGLPRLSLAACLDCLQDAAMECDDDSPLSRLAYRHDAEGRPAAFQMQPRAAHEPRGPYLNGPLRQMRVALVDHGPRWQFEGEPRLGGFPISFPAPGVGFAPGPCPGCGERLSHLLQLFADDERIRHENGKCWMLPDESGEVHVGWCDACKISVYRTGS